MVAFMLDETWRGYVQRQRASFPPFPATRSAVPRPCRGDVRGARRGGCAAAVSKVMNTNPMRGREVQGVNKSIAGSR